MILVIDTSRENANVITDILRFMGFLAYGTTPHEALGEYSNMYSAVIISNPEKFADIADYVRRLKLYDSRMTLFSISVGVNPRPDLFAINFRNNIYSTTLAKEMLKYVDKNKARSIGIYRTNDFEVSAGFHTITYNDKILDFSKTELRIVKFLVHTMPRPQMTDTIIKYVYPPNKFPEHSGLRSHICHINEKFRAASGKNLIEMKPREGYRLLVIPHAGDFIVKSMSTYF